MNSPFNGICYGEFISIFALVFAIKVAYAWNVAVVIHVVGYLLQA